MADPAPLPPLIQVVTPGQLRGLDWLLKIFFYDTRMNTKFTTDGKENLILGLKQPFLNFARFEPELVDTVLKPRRAELAQEAIATMKSDPVKSQSLTPQLNCIWLWLQTKPYIDEVGADVPVDTAFWNGGFEEYAGIPQTTFREGLDQTINAVAALLENVDKDDVSPSALYSFIQTAWGHLDTAPLEGKVKPSIDADMKPKIDGRRVFTMKRALEAFIESTKYMLLIMKQYGELALPPPDGAVEKVKDFKDVVLPEASYRYIGEFVLSMTKLRIMERDYVPSMKLVKHFANGVNS